MSMIHHPAPHPPAHHPGPALRVLRGGAPLILSRIGQPGVAAVLWQRALPAALTGWLDRLAPDRLPQLRHLLAPDQVASAMRAACAIAGTPADPARDMLIADVALLARAFAARLCAGTDGLGLMRLRLAVIRGDACPRFHIDRVRARLLCSYRGPGTLLARSDALGQPVMPALQIPRGQPALLRGRLWPGQRSGLLHRSPQIEGSGETRLLLVIDPDDAEDA